MITTYNKIQCTHSLAPSSPRTTTSRTSYVFIPLNPNKTHHTKGSLWTSLSVSQPPDIVPQVPLGQCLWLNKALKFISEWNTVKHLTLVKFQNPLLPVIALWGMIEEPDICEYQPSEWCTEEKSDYFEISCRDHGSNHLVQPNTDYAGTALCLWCLNQTYAKTVRRGKVNGLEALTRC